MKQKFDWYLFNAICYGICGVIWLYKGFGEGPGVKWHHVALAVLWLIGAAVWVVRTAQKRRGTAGETTEATDRTNYV